MSQEDPQVAPAAAGPPGSKPPERLPTGKPVAGPVPASPSPTVYAEFEASGLFSEVTKLYHGAVVDAIAETGHSQHPGGAVVKLQGVSSSGFTALASGIRRRSGPAQLIHGDAVHREWLLRTDSMPGLLVAELQAAGLGTVFGHLEGGHYRMCAPVEDWETAVRQARFIEDFFRRKGTPAAVEVKPLSPTDKAAIEELRRAHEQTG